MFKINCVDPSMLSDSDLKEEYRCLPRVFGKVLDTGESARWLNGVYRTYNFGDNHLKFFYTKCGYLKKRYTQLYKEAVRRGMKPSRSVVVAVFLRAKYIDKDFCGEWEPTEEDWAKNIKWLKSRNSRAYRKF